MKHRVSVAIVACIALSCVGRVYSSDLLDEIHTNFGIESVTNSGLTAFPVLEMPSGNRRDAMSGAYTAVNDPAGFFDGNPSASAGEPSSSLSIFHHEWIADSTIESVVFARSFGTVGFGGALKAYRVPFTAYDNVGSRAGVGYLAEWVAALNLSVLCIDRESFQSTVGTNIKGVFRYVSPEIENEQMAYSLPMDVGFQLRFRFLPIQVRERLNFSMGASLRNLAPKNMALDGEMPTQITAGVAYRPLNALLLSGDFVLPISLNPREAPAEPFYGSAGLSMSMTRFFDIHAGARIRAGDFRLNLGASIHLGSLSFITTYAISPASGLSPEESLSVAMSLDLLESSP